MTSAHGYADRLSTHGYKGKLDLPEQPDPPLAVLEKSRVLADRIKNASHVVVHTGAGISTSAGINDFRGPNGVWTMQRKRAKRPRTSVTPSQSHVTFDNAFPTLTHMALVGLQKASHVQYIISQNVDCLHLRSGFPREALSELHGNLFVEWCASCRREILLESQTETVGMKPTGTVCECGEPMTDKALDWDDVLPEPDFELAKKHSSKADFNLVVGTSCQMEPARSLPFRGNGGKKNRAIVNLSHTDFDDRCGICIRALSDIVFAIVAAELGVRIPPYEKLIKLILVLRWIDRGVHCRVLSKDGLVTHNLKVRYRCVDGDGQETKWSEHISEFPYQTSIETAGRHIEADVTANKGKLRLESIADRQKTTEAEGEIAVQRKEWQARSAELIKDLKAGASTKNCTSEESVEDDVWQQVWCGQNRRSEHMKDCRLLYE
ncbi:Sirtuin [Gracilaria domingensis]|nr:Sirtuin [Gracilaria domingensis]